MPTYGTSYIHVQICQDTYNLVYFHAYCVIGFSHHVKVERVRKDANFFQQFNFSFVHLVRRYQGECPTQVQVYILQIKATDIFVPTLLHHKHGKWKSKDDSSRTAYKSANGHGLRRRIRCRKSNCLQQESCSKCCGTECPHVLKMFIATEATTASHHLQPSLLQELHRTTDKWKVGL